MKNEKLPKFLLCVRYDARIALRNRLMNAFEEHHGECSKCASKVFLSKASVELLAFDQEVKPVCEVCAGGLNRQHGKPHFAITVGHLREMTAFIQKAKARNN